MIGIQFRFPGGQYHATPWQRHVNEADVEWPPSPWRILRSMISIWHRKAAYEQFSLVTLRALVGSFAKEYPEYFLPPAVHTNVRHYMPIGGIGNTTLVYDGFLHLDRDATLVVRWPGVTLAEDETSLLRFLMDKLGYLGRTESWVEARVIDASHISVNCVPLHANQNTTHTEETLSSGEAKEFTKVLVAMSDDEYASWREDRGQENISKAKKKDRISHSDIAEDLLEALSVDTNDLERAGRLQPPGSRWVVYERPVLNEFRAGKKASVASNSSGFYNAARFAFVSSIGPRIEETVDVADIFHMAILAGCGDDVPAIVSGREADGSLSVGHRHLFILPEDADKDGRVDHLTVYSSEPFPRTLIRAISKLTRLWTPSWWPGPSRKWELYFEGFVDERGTGVSQRTSKLPLLKAAQTWISCTPYLHPWHLKKNGKFGLEQQIRRELASRGLPSPVRIEPLPALRMRGRGYQTLQFRRSRRSKNQVFPDTRGSFWEIEFPMEISGPLGIGGNCHFGLGLFVPKDR